MYFEAVMHRRRPVASAEEAANLIHTQAELTSYDALCWTANGRELVVVSDVSINSRPWKEVAVIDLGRKVQIESITMGWIESVEEKARYLKDCETTDFMMGSCDKLPMDGNDGDTPAQFDCSCCGTGFESTYEVQHKYDQDAGYGLCPSCAKRRY